MAGIILKGTYDPETKKLSFEFKTYFLESHYEILQKCINERVNTGQLPEETECKKLTKDSVLISFPAEDLHSNSNSRNGVLPKKYSEPIGDLLEEFRKKSVKKELSTTEFIPLSGYPIEDLQVDIKNAIKAKRNFCIIDNYSEYLRFNRGESQKLRQKKLNYLSNEYADAAISIYEGDLKNLKAAYEDKLETVEWI